MPEGLEPGVVPGADLSLVDCGDGETGRNLSVDGPEQAGSSLRLGDSPAGRQLGGQAVVLGDRPEPGCPWPGAEQFVVGEHGVELHTQADVLARHQFVVPGILREANRVVPVVEELLRALQRQVRVA